MSENTSKVTAPYTSFPSFKTLLKNLKEHKVPARIDRSVLGNSFSNAVGSQLLTALKFLSLTGPGNEPTDDLEKLVAAYGTPGWKDALSVTLRKSYAPIFAMDLETATAAQFNERFRNAYAGTEDVVRKCITFFLSAVKDADIGISQYITKNKKPRTGPAKKRAAKGTKDSRSNDGTAATRNNGRNDDPPVDNVEKLPSEILLGLFTAGMKKEQKDALWTLIQFFKEEGK